MPLKRPDNLKFFSTLCKSATERSSGKIGAVVPSSKALAEEMVKALAPKKGQKILELGPGTGIFTKTLLKHGVREEDLTLIEFNQEFQAILSERFPNATLLHTDAFAYVRKLAKEQNQPFSGVISGLPLFSFPKEWRIDLCRDLRGMLPTGARYVQFTYNVKSPLPSKRLWKTSKSKRIWRNTPPAVVWTYERVE